METTVHVLNDFTCMLLSWYDCAALGVLPLDFPKQMWTDALPRQELWPDTPAAKSISTEALTKCMENPLPALVASLSSHDDQLPA